MWKKNKERKKNSRTSKRMFLKLNRIDLASSGDIEGE
jgi:hypothetical protein